MSAQAASWVLNRDAAVTGAVVESQQWVLSAMQKHGQGLLAMLWRILGNEQDVCDAYQDTFLQLANFRGGSKPHNVKAFVFRSASNVAISMLRRRKVHSKACRLIAAGTRHHSDPADELDARQLQEELRNHIARLPERLRNVVLLRDLAEMSYTEVAKILGIAVETARVYRCRAIRLLSVWMAQQKDIQP